MLMRQSAGQLRSRNRRQSGYACKGGSQEPPQLVRCKLAAPHQLRFEPVPRNQNSDDACRPGWESNRVKKSAGLALNPDALKRELNRAHGKTAVKARAGDVPGLEACFGRVFKRGPDETLA